MVNRNQYEFVRLVGNERRVGSTLKSVSRHWQKNPRFLFVSPHDDDAIIGGGLTMLSLLKDKIPVHVAVVTDGAQGYCSMAEQDTISDVREKETFTSLKRLGVPQKNVHWMGFPDCQLGQYQGRRKATPTDNVNVKGYTGLQNSFTQLLRKVRPTQIFLPTSSDLHPDHRIVHAEMLISCFHAAGAIWPELGKPLSAVPYIHEMAVYCNFPTTPKLRIKAPMNALKKKIDAIAEFRSQKQIKSLIELIRRAGPVEYLRPVPFSLYNPHLYRDMFEELPHYGYDQMHR
ncbi:MAG: PIG-L family deacetylase [Phycisphaerae bacterium]|nr:PIG-L family deacetylase [Phycisphaerae bacterium]